MKRFILIALVLINISIGCKKEDKSTGTTTPTASSCQNSIWKYEVILDTPVSMGTFSINYYDEFRNLISDTTITSSWIKNIGQQIPQNGNVITAYIYIIFGPSPHLTGTNLTNRITVNIYKDNVIVATTGGPIEFCQQYYPTPCPASSVHIISKSYTCSF